MNEMYFLENSVKRFRHYVAIARGYFCIPCPNCGKEFHGDEWDAENNTAYYASGNLDFQSVDLQNGIGVCSVECKKALEQNPHFPETARAYLRYCEHTYKSKTGPLISFYEYSHA